MKDGVRLVCALAMPARVAPYLTVALDRPTAPGDFSMASSALPTFSRFGFTKLYVFHGAKPETNERYASFRALSLCARMAWGYRPSSPPLREWALPRAFSSRPMWA